MRHFIWMTTFALLVALVFGLVGREGGLERVRYGIKIFLEFMIVGFALAWLLYMIPW